MRLLEIVRGPRTDPGVLVSALAFAKRVRKLGVVVGNGPGFVGNRLMFPYMYETQFLVEEGATPAQVDRALTGFGMAMGMFAVDDMAGLDVGCARAQALGHFSDPRERRPLVHDRLVAMGRLGQKRGAGWYRYDEPRTPTPDPEVEALIRSLAADAGIAARTDRRRGDRRARDPRARQRGRAGARGRRRGPRLGHRRHLRERLRVPGLARRAAVLRRSPRPRRGARPHPGVPPRARRALAAGAAARGARRARPARSASGERDEEPLTCRPPSRDACARRGCCRRTRSSAGTIAAGCASARRTPWGRIRRP